jgi:predicted nucleic acid-binding protein
MIIVADASPILHMTRIGQLHVVEKLLRSVLVPETVWQELIAPRTPLAARDQIVNATWISRAADPPLLDLGLDAGETAAIFLAEQVTADALLMDETKGPCGCQTARAGRSRDARYHQWCAPRWRDPRGSATDRSIACRWFLGFGRSRQ